MNELEMLRTIDPAADAREDEQAAARLLHAVLSEPRPAPRRRLPRRLLVAVPAAAAMLIALPLALHSSGESLAAKAYAATSPGDEIIHEVSVSRVTSPAGQVPTNQESWWRPVDGTARAIQYADGKKPSEIVIEANGVAHLHSPYATHPDEVLNPNGGNADEITRRFLDKWRNVTLSFRDDYAGQHLHDDGTTMFLGRNVHTYSADTKEWNREDQAYAHFHRTFYIDPDTNLPIGERVQFMRPDGTVAVDETTVIKSYEKLPATPENLAQVALKG